MCSESLQASYMKSGTRAVKTDKPMKDDPKRNGKTSSFIVVLAVLFFIAFLLSINIHKSLVRIWQTELYSHANYSPYLCPIRGDKWIVITTIHYPTPAIYKFLNLTTPWNLIVIADRKTPSDWLNHLASHNLSASSFSSRLLFLSLQQQQQQQFLRFRILQHLPHESYARKNLGYLIAIQCGAQIIFESDDDNLVETDDIFHLPKRLQPHQLPWFAFHRQRSLFVNIYASFGHPHIWPRGFPLEQLRNITEDGWHSLRQNQQNITHAYIQQYLADLDPDVDAIVCYQSSSRHENTLCF